MQDLKFALRAFIRTPGASGLVVITLAVAIAAATIIASTIDMVWRFIPAVRTDRWCSSRRRIQGPNNRRPAWPTAMARRACRFQTWSTGRRARALSRRSPAFTIQSAVLTGLDVPSRISTVRATRNLLDVWGITPQMGRTFAADEATPGASGSSS